MRDWYTIADVRAFLASRGRRVTGPHQLTRRVLHWPYCARCGLVALKNDETRRALRAPCVTWED